MSIFTDQSIYRKLARSELEREVLRIENNNKVEPNALEKDHAEILAAYANLDFAQKIQVMDGANADLLRKRIEKAVREKSMQYQNEIELRRNDPSYKTDSQGTNQDELTQNLIEAQIDAYRKNEERVMAEAAAQFDPDSHYDLEHIRNTDEGG